VQVRSTLPSLRGSWEGPQAQAMEYVIVAEYGSGMVGTCSNAIKFRSLVMQHDNDSPEQCSNERPDTLMQDHHLPGRQKISCNARPDHTLGQLETIQPNSRGGRFTPNSGLDRNDTIMSATCHKPSLPTAEGSLLKPKPRHCEINACDHCHWGNDPHTPCPEPVQATWQKRGN
jgi:hypothetical protein